MTWKRHSFWIVLVYAIGLAAGGCGSTSPSGGVLESPLAAVSPLSTESPSPVPTPTPTPTVSPTQTPTVSPTPTAMPIQLVVLHTNDNWGETEPCG